MNATIIKTDSQSNPQPTGVKIVLNLAGPTIQEYIQAGRDPRTYPPRGYAPKSAQDEIETVTAKWIIDNPERAKELPVQAEAAPLQSAVEIAVQQTKMDAAPDATPSTTAFLAELKKSPVIGPGGVAGSRFPARHWPKELRGLSDGKPIQFSPLTVHQVVAQSGVELCSPDELTQLKALEGEFAGLQAELDKTALTRVTDAWQRQRDNLDAQVQAGKLDGGILQTREAIHNAFIERNKSLTRALIKVTHERVIPLCEPILERFENVIASFLRSQEEADRETCLDWGIAYEPSALWRAAANAAIHYEAARRIPIPEVYASPKAMLEGVVEI